MGIFQSTEFVAAIAGAIVGGAITACVALLTHMVSLDADTKARNDQRRKEQQSLGYSLLFKVMRIYDNIYSLNARIEDSILRAENQGIEGELWKKIEPLVNVPAPIHFAANEMAVLLSLKNFHVFNDVAQLDNIHNAIVSVIKFYSDFRTSVTDLALQKSVGMDIQGERLRADIPIDETSALVRGKAFELESVARALKPQVERGLADSRSGLEELIKLLKEGLGVEHKVTFTE